MTSQKKLNFAIHHKVIDTGFPFLMFLYMFPDDRIIATPFCCEQRSADDMAFLTCAHHADVTHFRQVLSVIAQCDSSVF